MATRKIKDARDISTSELIYFRGHAGATFMSDGRTVEDAINNIKIEDTDSVVTKSDLDLKQDIITDLDTIRSGAALGYTSVQANQLAAVATSGNYNDLSNKPTIPTSVTESTVSGWGFTKNTGTYSKPSGGIPKTDLASAVQTSLDKANTALQSIPSEYVTETELTNKGYATTSAMNTGLSNKVDKVTGKSLSTNDFTTALKTKLEGLNNYDDTELSNAISTLRNDFNTLVNADASEAINTFNEIIAFLEGVKHTENLDNIIASIEQQIASKQDTLINGTNIKTINGESILGEGNIELNTTISDKSITKEKLSQDIQNQLDQLNAVLVDTEEEADDPLVSEYITSTQLENKLLNKQDTLVSGESIKTINGETILGSGDITIEEVTESTVSNWGFTKNTGTYSKPSGGIPKSDLDSSVQTSLGKADTALQSYTEQYKGTITGVSANGTSVATSGVANIPAATTSKYGVTKLSSSTNSTSTSLAATASAVKAAYDLANGKQAALVSGTNIKTINGQSILGSGDLVIETSSSGSGSAYAEVNHGVNDTTFTLTPNTFHIWDEVASLDLSFGEETAGVANEFVFQFTSGTTPTTLTLPDTIKWANENIPTISSSKTYQISILKGFANLLEFKYVKIYPESTEFGFPLYLNTEVVDESDTIVRRRDPDELSLALYSWLNDNKGNTWGDIPSSLLQENPIYIDGNLVTSIHAMLVDVEFDFDVNNYGYGNAHGGIDLEGSIYVYIGF